MYQYFAVRTVAVLEYQFFNWREEGNFRSPLGIGWIITYLMRKFLILRGTEPRYGWDEASLTAYEIKSVLCFETTCLYPTTTQWGGCIYLNLPPLNTQMMPNLII